MVSLQFVCSQLQWAPECLHATQTVNTIAGLFKVPPPALSISNMTMEALSLYRRVTPRRSFSIRYRATLTSALFSAWRHTGQENPCSTLGRSSTRRALEVMRVTRKVSTMCCLTMGTGEWRISTRFVSFRHEWREKETV